MTLDRSDRGWIAGLAGEGIVTLGDPRLKAPTAKFENVAEASDLLKTMVDRLRSLSGAGLAAPQIGASVRAAVVEVRKTDVFPDRPECPLIQMINPAVSTRSGAIVEDWEGCFSVPGMMGLVPRSDEITVEYLSPDGQRRAEEYRGYVARVIQHEIDHLDGIEFVDRMTSMRSLCTVQNYLQFPPMRPAGSRRHFDATGMNGSRT